LLATLQHETAALRLVGKTVNAANRESGPLQDLLQGGYSYLVFTELAFESPQQKK